MRKNIVAGLILAVALSVLLAACEDTKARQENEQLKTQVAALQKENTELKNNIEGLTKENASLKEENESLKAKPAKKKPSKAKHRRRGSRRSAG